MTSAGRLRVRNGQGTQHAVVKTARRGQELTVVGQTAAWWKIRFPGGAIGWAARRFGPDAVSPEITEDTAYLQTITAELQAAGIPATAQLLYGEGTAAAWMWLETLAGELWAAQTADQVAVLAPAAADAGATPRKDRPVGTPRRRPSATLATAVAGNDPLG